MNIEKTLSFTFGENEYKIEFPNNRQYIAIQNTKAALASNYDSFAFMGTEAQFAELLVDTQAHLTILCPDLIKDLNKPFGDLDLVDSRKLSEAYANQFRPWYNKWMNLVFGVEDKKESKSQSSQTGTNDAS